MSAGDITLASVERLSLSADDVLVFSTDLKFAAGQRERFKEIVREQIGDIRGWSGKVLLMDSGVRCKVLSPQQPITPQRLAEIAKALGWNEDWWGEGNSGELLRLIRAVEQELGIGGGQ